LFTLLAEAVFKHVHGLADPALRRYGRADQYGVGPIRGTCVVTSVQPARQCSLDGYVSPSASGWRLRADARLSELAPQLTVHSWAAYTHDRHGWSYDFALSEGRKTVQLGLRGDYNKRWLAEAVFMPVWGGAYNNLKDRDQLALAGGVRF
jgi:hypothetical protein